MSSYYDDPDFADEYRRRDDDALEWELARRAESRAEKPELGGWGDGDWTGEKAQWDPCQGGHPGGSWNDDGTWRCGRCGRALDLSPCGCGTEGHDELSRSYCPVASQRDRREVRRRSS